MKILSYFDAGLSGLLKTLVVLTGLAIAGMLTIGIFFRSVLETPVFGLEEIVLFCVMWFYMAGAVLASRERSHLAADFVTVIFENPRILKVIGIIATLISLIMAAFFTDWSWSLVSWGLDRGQTTPVFHLPMWVSQASMLFAAVCFVLYLLRDFISDIRGMF
ncbi:TRAP transporter small permease [Donghicola eburneus]|uniref:TRAP transporter small permease protein n=1 Tax=Donghicola eburneus TaxID=393278 RepID=A0A1M4MVR6_9RHOB|nr:TRAP transporter small permease subunit [Donghicola eburneus]SCM66552.1 TRAP ABC transporter permease [Donghicola eburneus]